jgi:hypothetical protein
MIAATYARGHRRLCSSRHTDAAHGRALMVPLMQILIAAIVFFIAIRAFYLLLP